jgi:hypothetical protein
MAVIVEGSEWLCEIFDGWGRLLLVALITTNLHIVSAFVDIEKAPHGHTSIGILKDDLLAKLQGVLCLEWGWLHGAQMKKMLDPIKETPLPVTAHV